MAPTIMQAWAFTFKVLTDAKADCMLACKNASMVVHSNIKGLYLL